MNGVVREIFRTSRCVRRAARAALLHAAVSRVAGTTAATLTLALAAEHLRQHGAASLHTLHIPSVRIDKLRTRVQGRARKSPHVPHCSSDGCLAAHADRPRRTPTRNERSIRRNPLLAGAGPQGEAHGTNRKCHVRVYTRQELAELACASSQECVRRWASTTFGCLRVSRADLDKTAAHNTTCR